MFGKNKKTVCDAWKLFAEVTKIKLAPAKQKSEIYEEDIA